MKRAKPYRALAIALLILGAVTAIGIGLRPAAPDMLAASLLMSLCVLVAAVVCAVLHLCGLAEAAIASLNPPRESAAGSATVLGAGKGSLDADVKRNFTEQLAAGRGKV